MGDSTPGMLRGRVDGRQLQFRASGLPIAGDLVCLAEIPIDFFRFEIYTVNRSNKIDLSEVGICTITLRMQRCSKLSVM